MRALMRLAAGGFVLAVCFLGWLHFWPKDDAAPSPNVSPNGIDHAGQRRSSHAQTASRSAKSRDSSRVAVAQGGSTAVAAYELAETSPTVFADLDRGIREAVAEGALRCEQSARQRLGSPPRVGGVVRFVATLKVVSSGGRAAVIDVTDVQWPAEYDPTMRDCLMRAVSAATYHASEDYVAVVALPIVFTAPDFAVPRSTDEGPW